MQGEYKRKFSLDSRPVEQMNLSPLEQGIELLSADILHVI